MIEVSVNLATHNRADFLGPCLISLCEQSVDPARFEICVVANACTDATPEIDAAIASR
jgi:glycosyltransferase involved in cell wall biosynthesis